jgi:hypothetical protein
MQRFLEKMKPLPVPNEDKEKAAEPSLGEPKFWTVGGRLQRTEAADSKRPGSHHLLGHSASRCGTADRQE